MGRVTTAMSPELQPTNVGEPGRRGPSREGASNCGGRVDVSEVLKKAAEWRWLLEHSVPEDPQGSQSWPAEGRDQETEDLDVLRRQLIRLHGGIGAVAQAMGVRLHDISGVEGLCGPSVLSALTGRSTDECGRALDRATKREAECFRSNASRLRAQAALNSEPERWKLAAEFDSTAEAIEDRPRSSRRVLKVAATALGLELNTVYCKEGPPQRLADFVEELEPGLYMVGVGDQTSSGHAVAIQTIGEERVWFADNGCRRPVPFFPSAKPLRQIGPCEIVWWCDEVDQSKAVPLDSEGLDRAVNQLAVVLGEIEAEIAVDDGRG